MDIHTKLMRKYKQVPEWWFVIILIANIALTIFACQYYNDQLQLPWWGVLLACGIAILFTLPIGIITAITNQVISFHIYIKSFGAKISTRQLIRRQKCLSFFVMTDTRVEHHH